MATVPVTPEVVSWAVDQSGFTVEQIADAVDTDAHAVRAWMTGAKRPSLGEARKLARKLRRPLALFLWPAPPSDEPPRVAFRAPLASEMRDLNPTERRYIRQAARLQGLLEHLDEQSGDEVRSFPKITPSMDPNVAATVTRDWLGITVEEQIAWLSEYTAFSQWRSCLQSHGVFVFALALGPDACRGITLANERVPVVIVNTAFNTRARIFTLFHELAHVLTRTTSACAASPAAANDAAEQLERWCEQCAATALMPWKSVEDFLQERAFPAKLDDLAGANSVARRYKVSLPAAVLRLIDGGRASWKLWRAIPRDVNAKASGGGAPEEPRTTPVVRLHEFGMLVARRLVRGLRADLIERSQVASYLRVDDGSLAEIERRVEEAQAANE
jgi:Zn-dependent peptidase ImmA (M78 family)